MVNYTCKYCKFIFDNKIAYIRHINRINKCKINNFGSKSSKRAVQYYCDACNKSYSRKDALLQHKKTKLHQNNIIKYKSNINSKNKLINNKYGSIGGIGINGNKNIIQNKNTIIKKQTINNYYICPFTTEGLNKLSLRDKVALFSSKENPIVMIVVKTNLNPAHPEYHNVGYRDLNSRYGIIFNGNTWEKKDIQSIMNELLNSKRKDLLKIHEEISQYLSNDDNKNISDALYDIENTIMPKIERHTKCKKKLVANLKTHLYNNRNLLIESIKKSGKPIMGQYTNLISPKKNILKNGMSIDDLDKILKEKSKKLDPKREIAKYIIELIKDEIDDNEYYRLMDTLNYISQEYEINTIIKLLCISYTYNININAYEINKKIKQYKEEYKLAKQYGIKIY